MPAQEVSLGLIHAESEGRRVTAPTRAAPRPSSQRAHAASAPDVRNRDVGGRRDRGVHALAEAVGTREGRRRQAAGRSAPAAPGPVVTHLTATEAGWTLGTPLSRAVAFSDNRGIVVAGGLDPGQNTVSSVVRIDPTTGATTSAGSLAVPAHDAAGATIGGKQFVFGGGAQHVSDVVQALQPNGPSAVVGHLPQPRADLAAATIGSTAYLVGGYDGTNATRDVLATSDGVGFRTVAQLPFGVRYPAVAAIGNSVYVFGGELGGAESAAVQQIDVRTGTVRVVAQLPSTRTEAAAVAVGGRIYVVGGLAGGHASSDVIAFDPKTADFSFDGQLPTPKADSAIATVGGTSFLLGGESAAVSSDVTALRETTTRCLRGDDDGKRATLCRSAPDRGSR